MSRRGFIKTIAAGIAILPFRNALASSENERILNLYNTHTGEGINIRYYTSGIYNHDALNEINYLLRDHYTNEVRAIDVKTLDLLCNIKDVIGKDRQVKIISGYRSFEYNEYLRSLGRKVGIDSLHLEGLAIDFEIPGISNGELCRIAKTFRAGGVGYYPKFVHIDTGKIRYW
ncbi:MAG: YcbK family protein [Nitrospirae bacterium]|nr:YcbK family protein [Nitrospirota bacterium]